MDKKKAVELVIEYEKKQGRNPEKVDKFKEGYDLKSGERLIEVKTNGNFKSDLLLSFSNFKKLGKKISNYYVYFLIGEDKPKLKIIEPDFIIKNMNLLTLINFKSKQLNEIQEVEL